MESLSRWFERELFAPDWPAGSPPPAGGPVCTVIGSGGKTSLIWLLARSLRRRKVLVSPTTKMFPPPPEYYDHYFPGGPGFAVPPGGGISLAGPLNPETGKLEALPPGLLAAMVPGYDLALLEGDGSRGLPLKGWAGHEPVVPPYTTLSVGVIPISPLGEKVSEALVFRLPQFTRLTGAGEGDRVSAAHLAALITGNGGGRGLFYAARGKKLLFINQVEGAARREEARNLAASLPAGFLAGLEGLIAGSVEGDCLEVLYSRRLLRGAPGPCAAQPPGRKG